MWHSRLLIISAAIILVVGAVIGTAWNQDYRRASQGIRAMVDSHVPDTRVEVADIEIHPGIATIEVTGETSDPDLHAALTTGSFTSWLRVKADIRFLPDSSVEGRTNGVVSVAVANLRKEPRHGAELVDQAILGSDVRILKKSRGWYLVQTPWDYLGWVTGASLHFTNAHTTPTHRITATSSPVRRFPADTSLVLVDAPYGATLALVSTSGRYSQVLLPDSTTGFVLASHVGPLPRNGTATPDSASLIATAMSFHGIPYLWGGNSTSGFDCSGFTQTVYKAQGITLPRDANMQFELGEDIPFADDFSNVRAGDLLYFGPSTERITHVAISLGGPRIIHASDYVMINSLDSTATDYAPDRRATLQAIKRLR